MPEVVARWAAGLGRLDRRPGDVLAAVADAVDVTWDGPGRASRLTAAELTRAELPRSPGWVLLDAAREALLDPGTRRRLGAHHTPPDLAGRLVDIALDGLPASATVVDPACGGGAFLVAAADTLVARGADPGHVVAEQLIGLDVDPLAVATTRAALRCWATSHGVDVGDGEPAGIRRADGLVARWSADAVVGNPPFLSPLGATTGGGAAAARQRARLGAPYADVAWLFLLRALHSARPGGRVVLMQPESLLSARDARLVREAAGPHLEGVWVAGARVFGAAVRVCAPVLRVEPVVGRVQRWHGNGVRPAGRAVRPAPSSWAGLLPTTTPRVRVRSGPIVGDLATATAGFRDEFYGLAEAAAEGGAGQPLITSGLIDPGRLAWGERPARIGGRRFSQPTVDGASLRGPLAVWVAARAVPKVLVATQTRVIEAAADPTGRAIPLTPVLSVEPRRVADVWRLAAALTSPLVSAWALQAYGGAALSADAIKLSATQVLEAPLPVDQRAWATATRALRRGNVVTCGSVLSGGDRRLLAWWLARLPTRTP